MPGDGLHLRHFRPRRPGHRPALREKTGEVVAIQRGSNKSFCRVVWVGEPNSELNGQIGLQCVESDRLLWENELRDMEEVYELIHRDSALYRLNSGAASLNGNRRRHQRFEIEGIAELPKLDASLRGKPVSRISRKSGAWSKPSTPSSRAPI